MISDKFAELLMTGVGEKVRSRGIGAGTGLAGNVSLGLESTGDGGERGKEYIKTFDEALNTIIDEALVDSKESLSASQKAMLHHVAPMALDPKSFMESANSLEDVKPTGKTLDKIEAYNLGIEDIVEKPTLGLESFDGQDMSRVVRFIVAYNAAISKQDAFSSGFFPMVVIDPAVASAKITARITKLYSEFARDTTGTVNADANGGKALVKAIYDAALLGDKNRIVPVKRANNTAVLEQTISYTDETRGESVVTSPIKIGAEVDLLGLSQTDAMLLKGTMDQTDALDQTLYLTDVFFTLFGSNGSTDVTEIFSINAKSVSASNFTYTAQGTNKDLDLNFKYEDLVLRTNGSSLTSSRLGGAVSAILNTLTGDYLIYLRLKLRGDGNTKTGTIVVENTVAELVKVTTPAGVEVTSGADYDAIVAVTDTFTVTSYAVEAYTRNSNLRADGQFVGVDVLSTIYPVPVRTGTAVEKTLGTGIDIDNDTAYLGSQVTTTGAKMSQAAVSTLVNYAATLKSLDAGSKNVAALKGIGKELLNLYYEEPTITVNTDVNSLRSGEKASDITGLLVETIRNYVTDAYVSSNLSTVRSSYGMAGPVDVIVGTDSVITSYLPAQVDIGTEFNVKVVTTANPAIKGKMYVTFTNFNISNDNKMDPLAFGCTFMAPSATVDVQKSINGKTTKVVNDFPRYTHVAQLPVMTVFTITGITEALKKVAIDFHSV